MRYSTMAIGCVPQPYKTVLSYSFVQITNEANVGAKVGSGGFKALLQDGYVLHQHNYEIRKHCSLSV